jgi:hypothetical protein
LQRGRHNGKLLLALCIVAHEILLTSQDLQAVLQVAVAPVVFIQRQDGS